MATKRRSRPPKRRSRRSGDAGGLHVRTDRKWHDFLYRNEVPDKILRSEFDWIDPDETDHFLKYHDAWYHLSQFEVIPKGSTLARNWDGMMPSSASTADVIKVSPDHERYKIGSVWYTSS
jgi:hypothetical protein